VNEISITYVKNDCFCCKMKKEGNRVPELNYILEVTVMAAKKETVISEAKSKEMPTAKIKFVYPAPEADKVSLAGDFNNWDTLANPMKKTKKGIWEVTVNLKQGKYEYRFYADEKWENDPLCTECVPNTFGSMNCIKVVA
jgi:1,4-alpha-glucan branching enzyme